MSTHDRGAFGQLLAEAKALGASEIRWQVDLTRVDEDPHRWSARTIERSDKAASYASGRTGEEALRRLVEKLRG